MERDKKPLNLALTGCVLTVLCFLVAFAATVTPSWATDFGGTTKSPWRICSVDGNCDSTSLNGIVITGASVMSGIFSVLCSIFLLMASGLSVLVSMMHIRCQRILLSFRTATLSKMAFSSSACLASFFSVVAFVVDMYLVSPRDSLRLSWSFFLEAVAFVMGWVVAAIASTEWYRSRGLGGDPTVYARDPEGKHAETIANPAFRETSAQRPAPRRKTPSSPNRRRLPSPSEVHRNRNGIAMTHASGLPYQLGNGTNGCMVNGQAPTNGGALAFDPSRTPKRSSLRRPKTQNSLDSPDANVGIPNPAFSQSTPPMKKKVRINTQSTAV